MPRSITGHRRGGKGVEGDSQASVRAAVSLGSPFVSGEGAGREAGEQIGNNPRWLCPLPCVWGVRLAVVERGSLGLRRPG